MYMKIVISEEQLKKIVESAKDTPNKRKTLDFFDLVSKGILFVVQPHENGERVKPRWEHDSNLITLWNLEHPESGQEWVKKAKYFTKTGSIWWWNDIGQFNLSDEKYNQILKSIDLYKEKNKKDDSAKFLKCAACKKLFTQTIYKKKKSLAICPWCGKHNTHLDENQDVEERSRSFAFTRKKRLFSKAELMANPARYRKYERDLKEIDVYKFMDSRGKRKPTEQDYNDVIENSTEIGDFGPYTYYYDIREEETQPTLTFFILDRKNKEYVGYAAFEVRYGNEFFVTLPYIREKYRNQGIATQIYKLALTMGSLNSGKAQSYEAVGLWRKLFKTLRDHKMVYVDDYGKEYGVYEKNNDLYTEKTDDSVYRTKGGSLKIYPK